MEVYSGEKPYIFVSYAHNDASIVVPIIEKLQTDGFRIWYDKGIEAGTEWPQNIAEHLADAACIMIFMSHNSANSHNCRNEINLASELKKEMFIIHLEDFEMSLGLRLQLNLSQAIYKNRSLNDDAFYAELKRAKIIQFYREGNEELYTLHVKQEEKIAQDECVKKHSKVTSKRVKSWSVIAIIFILLLVGSMLTVMNKKDNKPSEIAISDYEKKDEIITDYETFYGMLIAASEKLGCNSYWIPSSLIDNRIIEQDDEDVWITYYTDSIALENASLHLGFRNEGEEIIAILDNIKSKDEEVAYKILECVSSSVRGFYLTDFIEVLTNDDRVPWKELDISGHSIWNEVLELEDVPSQKK